MVTEKSAVECRRAESLRGSEGDKGREGRDGGRGGREGMEGKKGRREPERKGIMQFLRILYQ